MNEPPDEIAVASRMTSFMQFLGVALAAILLIVFVGYS
jgi:hypothetical protein